MCSLSFLCTPSLSLSCALSLSFFCSLFLSLSLSLDTYSLTTNAATQGSDTAVFVMVTKAFLHTTIRPIGSAFAQRRGKRALRHYVLDLCVQRGNTHSRKPANLLRARNEFGDEFWVCTKIKKHIAYKYNTHIPIILFHIL